MSQLVLASKSPRRQALLKLLRLPFRVLTAETSEEFEPSLSPEEVVSELALRKGKAVCDLYPDETANAITLAADTIVVLDGEILNKPTDEAHAFEMLSKLQGRTHEVFTGFALMKGEKTVSEVERTAVTFAPMTSDEIRAYIRVAKPFDKAGAYGIQDDFGACFIERVEGCYYNVVGLPLAKLYKTLKRFEQ
ncbi:MAG: Maf family protein [Chloroherpetonaceae bacterium]|nr:Maf family protein [Chloroherpetonaceae bacterium]MDW8437591.1 Maf family protein [Chloroherpetonaceae bacterium]